MTNSETVPKLSHILIVLFAYWLSYASGENWAVAFWRIGTAVWLFAFAYTAVVSHVRKETVR